MTATAFDTLLSNHRGGVWFAPSMDAKKAKAAAKKAKYAFFHVEGKSVQRKEQLMNALATALRLPEDFGHNWDALEECLIDLEWVDGEGYVLVYEHIDPLAEAHPDQLATLLEILKDAVDSWKEDDTALIVILTGARAPKGVPALAA